MKNKIIKFISYILIIQIVILMSALLYTSNASNTYKQYVKTGIEQFPDSYKTKLQTLANKYPNWKFQAYYTGISWDELIKKERDDSIYRNRVHVSTSEAWKHTCGFVEDGWACASDEAVKYCIDPRNYLTETQIFQFVETSYNPEVQTLKAIQDSVKGTFLDNTITCKDLNNNTVTMSYSQMIIDAAKKTNISAFYIKSKIIQEVGVTGSGSVTGKYPGYEGYYNFFNYGANDEGDDIANGLLFARGKGWNSQYKAIVGGAELIGKYYINSGQNTLYFNKWDVVGTKILKDGETQTVLEGDLFWHQYMTNIQDPYSQAFSYKNLYANSLQSQITFIIPVYNNMPEEPAPVPTEEYKGNINTELINIENLISSNGSNYIAGSIYIAEWVGNDCRTPKGTPKMTLKSTDGKVIKKMYVAYQEGIKYYFDINIEKLDTTKEYFIEVQLTGDKNIATQENKTQIARFPDKILNEDFKGKVIKTINNKIRFSDGKYVGNINTTLNEVKIVQNAKGENYIAGYVDIGEWIGTACNAPKTMPEIWLKSTDRKVNKKTYISYEGGITYYFDTMIQYLDLSKEYYLEAILVTEENTASLQSRTQKLRIGTQEIGKFVGADIKVVAKNDNFVLKYKGSINTELINLNIIQNAKGDNYISGSVYIAEWVNGECRTPSVKPQIKLKSADGKFETNVFVNYEGGIRYYFDKNIEGINTDITQEYILEAVLTNENNIAPEIQKIQQIRLPNKTIGKNGTISVKSNNNKIIITDNSLYRGTINTELYEMKIIQNSKGDNYISGFIYIAEWVNGECRTPSTKPQIKLKSVNGDFETDVFVNHEGGIKYYFDKNIQNIDITQEYYLEVKLTSNKNLSSEIQKTQTAKITPQGQIGTWTNGNKVIITGNNIKIINKDMYYGTINTELYEMNIIQNAKGDNYISGFIYIAEWVNGDCRTPLTKPQIKLKSVNGDFETNVFVNYEGGIKYYFDKNIEGINKSGEYYLEVKLTSDKNLSSEIQKTQTAKITQQGQIGTCTNGNIVKIDKNNINIIVPEIKLYIQDELVEKQETDILSKQEEIVETPVVEDIIKEEQINSNVNDEELRDVEESKEKNEDENEEIEEIQEEIQQNTEFEIQEENLEKKDM